MRWWVLGAVCLGFLLSGCATQPYQRDAARSYEVFGKRYYVMKSAVGFRERGIASWYGKPFHGRKTANGETYNMYAISAAHKHLPLPTWLEVRNLENGRKLIVRVNDRGPFHGDRIIDLSYAAAKELGFEKKGLARVELRYLPPEVALRKLGRKAPSDWVQVGAFRDRARASELARRLSRASGLASKLEPAGHVYRLRLKRPTSASAQRQLNQVLRQHGLSAVKY